MLDALPWPNVRGKRCLVMGEHLADLRSALEHRGAEAVDVLEGPISQDVPPQGGPYDLTFGWAIVSGAESPAELLRSVRSVTAGLFVSIEPVDLVLTILGRPLPLMRPLGPTSLRRYSMNGKAHHLMLTAAGFTVERPSKVVGVRVDAGLFPAGRARHFRGRVPHRALVARANP